MIARLEELTPNKMETTKSERDKKTFTQGKLKPGERVKINNRVARKSSLFAKSNPKGNRNATITRTNHKTATGS